MIKMECDRCGAQERTRVSVAPTKFLAKAELPGGWRSMLCPERDGSNWDKHLCPDCAAALWAFMDGTELDRSGPEQVMSLAEAGQAQKLGADLSPGLPVPCPVVDCTDTYPRGELVQHIQDCHPLVRPVMPVGAVTDPGKLAEAEAEECPKLTVAEECPYCDDAFAPSRLGQHVTAAHPRDWPMWVDARLKRGTGWRIGRGGVRVNGGTELGNGPELGPEDDE